MAALSCFAWSTAPVGATVHNFRPTTVRLHPANEVMSFALTGVLDDGVNGKNQTPGPFGNNGSLAGQPYRLVYAFYPARAGGPQYWPSSPGSCPPDTWYKTWLAGTNAQSPGFARLTINSGTYTFMPGASGTQASITMEAAVGSSCLGDVQMSFLVQSSAQDRIGDQIVDANNYPLGVPVNIWPSSAWQPPRCKYVVERSILYHESGVTMQFSITDSNLSASGEESGVHRTLTLTITDSLYPCN